MESEYLFNQELKMLELKNKELLNKLEIVEKELELQTKLLESNRYSNSMLSQLINDYREIIEEWNNKWKLTYQQFVLRC